MAELSLKEELADMLGCPRTPDGFCYCEMCQTKYWGKAESILSTIRAKVGEIENPYQENIESDFSEGFIKAMDTVRELLK